ncbi:hypothetical protein V6N12_042390 [Hibiscus sabdariffa]|uniref:Uncharacterized protein n=1 Tax=Hibiscus sabdariffa TaxID=183260 RepID=A0ABR2EIB6_9ROSI
MGKSMGLRRVNFSSSGAIQTTCCLFLLVSLWQLETETAKEHLQPRVEEVEGGDKDRQMDDAIAIVGCSIFSNDLRNGDTDTKGAFLRRSH